LQGLDIGVVGPRGKVGVVAAHEGGDAVTCISGQVRL